MLQRFIDPVKIDIDVNCVEFDLAYVGEKVEGRKIRAFELVESGEVNDEIKVIGELNDVLGINIKISGIDDTIASALESLIPEIMNRIKGLRYDFRKENVIITISDELLNKLTLDCVAKILHKAFSSLKIGRVKVILIADRDIFNKESKRAYKIHKAREERSRISEEDVDEFYGCFSCQVNLPNHVCVISPEKPSPCGTTWNEAKAANELGIVSYYFKMKKGATMNGGYEGINKKVEELSGGSIKQIELHSVLVNPPPTGLYSELLVFYIPEKDGFGIVDRDYKSRTPIGLSFDEIERIIVGKQVEGFVGISYSYLKSPKFLKDEGGWKRIVWVSPKVYDYIKDFVDEQTLKNIEVG